MKKVRVNKKYGIWYYEKEEPNYDLEFSLYTFWNEIKKECYCVASYRQMLECIKEPTKELREKYIDTYC